MLRLADGNHEVDRRNDDAVDTHAEDVGDDPLLASDRDALIGQRVAQFGAEA